MAIAANIHINKVADLSEGINEQFSLGVVRISVDRVRISVWLPGEEHCQLCLYKDGKIFQKIPMTSMKAMGIKDIFTITLAGEKLTEQLKEMEYDFRVRGEHRMDPYARLVRGREKFGKKYGDARGYAHGKIRCGFIFDDFDWTGEKWKHLDISDMIIYEANVRSFTRHSSSGVKHPGTFDGMREKIPYLKKLGVNTLFLLPVYEFDEWMRDEDGHELDKINCWGYGSDAFYFAPKSSYSSDGNAGEEFKELVKCMHQNGMNIILDFYFTEKTPAYILSCLRYYVLQYHIDGFHVNQGCMDSALLQRDPVLSHAFLVGNSWNRASSGEERVLEMNDGFLVDARRFLKSDEGQTQNFYRRFQEKKNGVGVIHYIASHNGFTLRDMLSYDVKHNEPNGERGMDGTEYNYSWNCGFEGPTRRKAVLSMRQKQERNAFVMLFLGMAIPMIMAGDEFGRSQKGNNNAYCIDNATTWLDWRLLEKNKETFQFVKKLIQFRKNHSLYHQKRALRGTDANGSGAPDVSCHGREPWVADFSYYSRELGILYCGTYYAGKSLYFAFNFHWDSHEFYLPDIRGIKEWDILFDTAESGICEINNGRYHMAPRSIVVFEEKEKQEKKTAAAKRKRKRMPAK